MEESDSSRVMMIGMVGMVGMMMGLTMVTAFLPAAAAPPVIYTCPLCGAEFASEEELITHFETEHPSELIDIIWE
ncbi:MAG: hypothetical protein PHI12_12865 [Dehalococcoidales bacterium]|nr:hypothetical protein [Dehalococcoidales bacterium]